MLSHAFTHADWFLFFIFADNTHFPEPARSGASPPQSQQQGQQPQTHDQHQTDYELQPHGLQHVQGQLL